jgi:hypothetical protein
MVSKIDVKTIDIDEICKLLQVPFGMVGKMIRNAGEAKDLYECSINANVLSYLLKLIAILHVQKVKSDLIVNKPQLENAMLVSVLHGCNTEVNQSIDRLMHHYTEIMNKFDILRQRLLQYAEINMSVSLDLSCGGITPLSREKKKLSEIQAMLANRIEFIQKGCPSGFDVNTMSWEEVFETKRIRQDDE